MGTDHRALARLHFFQVADHLLAGGRLGAKAHNRHARLDKGKRPVFHLSRRVGFGVKVGDLFQFERCFACDGERRSTADAYEICRGRKRRQCGGPIQIGGQTQPLGKAIKASLHRGVIRPQTGEPE